MIQTIGHSTLTQEQFTNLVSGLDLLIDVRSHPSSRWPQFHKSELERYIPASGVDYQWWPQLGGWDARHGYLVDDMAEVGIDIKPYLKGIFPKGTIAKKNKLKDNNSNQLVVWTSQGLLDYSWFMTLPEFISGMDDLISLHLKGKTIGIFCSEYMWWKCHRSMISDYLYFLSIDSTHLQPKLTPHFSIIGNRLWRYDPRIHNIWEAHKVKNWYSEQSKNEEP